jgi:hypothetical protein
LAAMFVLLRASRRSEKTGYLRASVRFTLRAAAAIVLFAVIMKVWNFGEEKISEQIHPAAESRAPSVDPTAGDLNLNFPSGEAVATAKSIAGLATADDPHDVEENARKLLESAKRAGATDRQLRDARSGLIELIGEDSTAENVAALDSVLIAVAGQAPAQLTGRDSMEAVIGELRADVKRLGARGDALSAELEEAKERRGLRTFLAGIFDDLGLGFGWAAVFFTGFLAMMRGQTPGKKLFGIRVIRLDGKPIGWWIAFERFGGYAASFSVGLLGFLQILWDRNRQGLHDKACETVVIRDTPQSATRS